jgi:hypothetical protein
MKRGRACSGTTVAQFNKLPLDAEWAAFRQFVEECKIDTGIPDLAHQHDHSLYGKPKKAAHGITDASTSDHHFEQAGFRKLL